MNITSYERKEKDIALAFRLDHWATFRFYVFS